MFTELHTLGGAPVAINPAQVMYFTAAQANPQHTTIITGIDTFDVTEDYAQVKLLFKQPLTADNVDLYMEAHSAGYKEGYNHRKQEESND